MNSNIVQERHLSHNTIFLQYKIENFFMQKIYIPGIWKPNIPKNIYLKICFLCTPSLFLRSVR